MDAFNDTKENEFLPSDGVDQGFGYLLTGIGAIVVFFAAIAFLTQVSRVSSRPVRDSAPAAVSGQTDIVGADLPQPGGLRSSP